jgi:KDO2-lipid IV(A) lauroyltransferase
LGKSLGRALAYTVVRVLMIVARTVARSHALRLFGAAGLLARRVLRAERILTEVNLSLALPEYSRNEVRKLGRRVWVDLGRNCVDALRLPYLSWHDLPGFVEVQGLTRFEEILSRGRGVLVVTGHIGCWELLTAYFSMLGYPVGVTTRPLQDARLEKLIDGLRRSKGIRTFSGASSEEAAYACLKRGHILAVLIDRDTSVKGVFCDFFGQPAFTPVYAAVLALRAAAPIVPMAIHLRDDGLQVIRLAEPIEPAGDPDSESDVRSVMQRCTKAIEVLIRLQPTQWVWMQERWKTVPVHTESEKRETANSEA